MKMLRDPMDGKPGLRLETAASVTLRDTIKQHFAAFSHVVSKDRTTGQAVVAAYVDGLAGAVALVVAGKHGRKNDATEATIKSLRDAIERDLKHMRVQ